MGANVVASGPRVRLVARIGNQLRDPLLIVLIRGLGARKHTGVGRLLAGSVSHYCLSHSTVPVAAVPAQDAEGVPTRSDEIVLGLDDSPSGVEALTWAAGLARTSGRRLRAIHLLGWPRGFVPKHYPTPPERYLPRSRSTTSTEPASPTCTNGVDPEPGWLLQFAEGHPGKVLVEQSTSSALLVVGTQEQVGLGRLLLGSVSHYALSHANCPVVAVPARLAFSANRKDTNMMKALVYGGPGEMEWRDVPLPEVQTPRTRSSGSTRSPSAAPTCTS